MNPARAPLPAGRGPRGLRRRRPRACWSIGDSPIADLRAADRQRPLLARRHRLHALLRDAADLHRPGGGGGVPLRPAQYRRGRAALRRGVRDRLGRHHAARRCRPVVLLPLCFLAAVLAGARLGRHPRGAEGALRIARSHQHDHVELHRGRAGELLHPVPLQDAGRSDHGDGADRRAAHTSPRLGTFHSRISRAHSAQRRVPARAGGLRARVRFLWRTKWGYEIRATGSNPSAAEYGGISIRRQIVLAMAVSGALAGMVGINEVLGYRYRYYDGFSAQLRLHRHRRRAARPQPSGRGAARGAAVRGAACAAACPWTPSPSTCRRTSCRCCRRIVILFVAAEALFRGPFAKFGLLRRAQGANRRRPCEISDRVALCLDDAARDAAGAGGARRPVLRARGGDQHRARRA